MKILAGILVIFLGLNGYSQIENKNGLLIFAHNAYFIEIDSLTSEITPELIMNKIQSDTVLVINMIPGSMLNTIMEKSVHLPYSCSNESGNLFVFPCTVESLKYGSNKVADPNCIFCISSKTICGVFKSLHRVNEFKLNYQELVFNSCFVKNKESNEKRFSNLTPGLFCWDW